MAYDPSIFNINPYYDDFAADKGFLRVLFKPGYALQARELTQLQSILQDQLSKVGNHLFKDGSRIVGGGISVRNASFVRITVGEGTPLAGVTDYAALVGGFLTSTVSGNTTKAKVVHYIAPDADSDNYLVLVVDFVSGTGFTNNLCNFTKDAVSYNSLSIPSVAYATGESKLVSVAEGIFYIDGFFTRTGLQYFTPYTTEGLAYRDLNFSAFSTLSKRIGFSISRDSVTEQEDSTLRDPSIGAYNYNAPGADRYKITLSLSQTDLDQNIDDFVELLRFEGGKVTKKIDRITYGDISNALARRTYDESGSYTVRPFDLVVKDGDSTNLSVSVGDGKAYVYGYEVENQHPQAVVLPKARVTQTETAVEFPFSVGNYLGVSLASATTTSPSSATNVSTNLATIGAGGARFEIRTPGGVTVAVGQVHGAIPTPERTTSNAVGATGYYYRLYFHGISGTFSGGRTGYIYNNATNALIGEFTPQTAAANSTFSGICGTNDASLVYELKPGYAIDTISSLRVYGKLIGDASPTPVTVTWDGTNKTTYTITKGHFVGTIDTANQSVFSFPAYGTNNNSSTDIQRISFVRTDGIAFRPNSGSLSVSTDGSQVTLDVTNAPTGFTLANAGILRAVMPVIYTPSVSDVSTYRTKTSTTTTATFSSLTDKKTDENGRKYYEFPQLDVYTISGVSYTSATQTTPVDVTEDFELDDGQRETFYTRSRLYLKEAAANSTPYNTTTSIKVGMSYFAHGGLPAGPFLGKHSYVNVPYEQIPLYTNPRTGKSVSLANCIDFRHDGATGTVPMLKPYGLSEFGSSENTLATFSHYLPRIDKLCVKADPEDGSALFYIVQGTPDLSPVAPPDPADGLVLATLTIPAYTHNNTDVVLTPVESKRFTMSDIGKIQKRVDEVEVFAKLSLSESEIEARSVKSPITATVEPLKTSIFADEFYGHSIADVSDSTHSCSVDYERGELRPFFTSSKIVLPSPVFNGTTVSPDGLITLNYSPVSYIENTQYTKTVQINPTNTVNWLGFMKLSQSIEPYFDTGYRPVVKTNALMENDNWVSSNANNDRGFGTQWNDWESLWTGIENVEEEQDDVQKRIVELPRVNSTSSVPSFNSGNVRIGVSRKVDSVNQKTSNFIRARQLKNRIKQSIGSRVVDRSVVPYIPTNTVTATVHGLKPNATGLSVYFDGELVKSGIVTDQYGSCTVQFGISAGEYLAGTRVVRISDSATVANSTIAAEAVYHCTGALEQRDSGSYSTRPPELRRQTTSSETLSKDPFNRDIDSVENTHWSDPLSQTFFVDKKTNPDGVFLKSVSLYFAAKDSTLPVTVQIRPTVGGYPSPSVVIPFSTVVKAAADVTANSSAPTETEFSFSSPVYLEPGEYAICVLANSDDYELFAADSAFNGRANTDATVGRAGNNQLVGTLYTAQGLGPAVAENITDLMFKVKRCEFVSQGTASYNGVINAINSQILKFYAPEIVPTSATLTRSVAAGAVSASFMNNESVYLNTLFTANPNLTYSMNRGANTAISPVVDTAAMYAASVQMYTSASPTTSRYVSRIVELPEELVSNGLAVFVDANIPSGASITVKYRVSSNGESEILTKSWQSAPTMTRQTTPAAFTSTSEIDFREAYFRTGTVTPNFKCYQIMVELVSGSANPTYYKTPAVRNIRTVSFVQ